MNLKNSFRIAVLVALVCALTLALSACDSVDDGAEYLYFLNVDSVENVDGTLIVRLSPSVEESEKTLDGVSTLRTVSVSRKNAFYDRVEYTFSFDGEAIFSATENFLAQYGANLGVETYSNLKIVFDYATIYKSTKSDCVATERNGKYVHSSEIFKANTEFKLYRDFAHSSSWYGLTAGIAAAMVLVVVVVLVKRGKYGGKV